MSAQKWAEFKKRLEVKIMDNTPSGVHKEGVEWAIANGILTGNGEGGPNALSAGHPAADVHYVASALGADQERIKRVRLQKWGRI